LKMCKAVVRSSSGISFLTTMNSQIQTNNNSLKVANKETTNHRCLLFKNLFWISNQLLELKAVSRVHNLQPWIVEFTSSPASKSIRIQTRQLCRDICQVSRAAARLSQSRVRICLLKTQSLWSEHTSGKRLSVRLLRRCITLKKRKC